MPNTDRDRFAKLLAIETLESRFGYACVRARADDKFLNGADIAHGGFLFTLADFACALATNADGRLALSSGASIEYLAPCPAETEVEARASFTFSNRKTALCSVKIVSANDPETIYAVFQSRLIFKSAV